MLMHEKTCVIPIFEHKTFLKLHTMTIGQHFWAILGVLAVDKRRNE